ncbi:MAG TPA: hypothetical protein VK148_08055 [Xanthobacteraceae bacterium]|nr:hypothetical protein [Xanthobacteraceae bacterium]
MSIRTGVCVGGTKRRRVFPALIAAASILTASNGTAGAAEDASSPSGAQTSTEALLQKLQAMEQRIKSLEGQLKKQQPAEPVPAAKPAAPRTGALEPGVRAQAAGETPGKTTSQAPAKAAGQASPKAPADPGMQPKKPILGLLDSPVEGLAFGAYGEVKYGAFRNPDAGGKWQNGFDAHRLVLLPTYAITPNIIFNAEIELEHGGIAFDADDKRHGSAEIEQMFVDFKIADQFNWRAPGIDLVPIGFINQRHEPTQFYSVNRPEIYNGLIPSTFMVPSSSIYGRLMDGLSYQVQISTSIEDFGSGFDLRSDANGVLLLPGGYAPGITGLSALHDSRPVVGDFRQLSNTMAYAGKLDFRPSFLPGFAGSVSGYFSPNVTPRGAFGDFGNTLGRASLGIFDAEFRYRVPDTGLELRGEYAQVFLGKPENMRANNDTDPTNNVGKTMYAASGEIAYHFPLGTILNSEWEAVPFYRYTYENLQTSGFAGTDANTPTGAGQLQFHTLGIAVFPSPKLVLKATYQKVINRDPAGAQSDSFLGGLGFFF